MSIVAVPIPVATPVLKDALIPIVAAAATDVKEMDPGLNYRCRKSVRIQADKFERHQDRPELCAIDHDTLRLIVAGRLLTMIKPP